MPAKITYFNKIGYKCVVHGSYIEINGSITIFSFEGNLNYTISKDKIEKIEHIKLNL